MKESDIKNAELKKICERIDSRLKKNKDAFVEFAKSKGYEFYAEYVYVEFQTRTAESLRKEMKPFIKPHTVASLWGITSRVDRELRDFEDGILPDVEKKVIKICYQCKKDVVPPENHALCRKCDLKRQQALRSGGSHEVERHMANGYFF